MTPGLRASPGSGGQGDGGPECGSPVQKGLGCSPALAGLRQKVTDAVNAGTRPDPGLSDSPCSSTQTLSRFGRCCALRWRKPGLRGLWDSGIQGGAWARGPRSPPERQAHEASRLGEVRVWTVGLRRLP